MTRNDDEREMSRLSDLTLDFSSAMRDKLWKKYYEGYRGWEVAKDSTLSQEEKEESLDKLRRGLGEHILRYANGLNPSQLVDIGNYVAMLWNLEVRK